MWIGVTNGLAGIKFSVSPKRYGFKSAREKSPHNIIANPNISLKEKYGWKGILSKFDLIPKGLFDPVW
jgi:hypothetical protein